MSTKHPIVAITGSSGAGTTLDRSADSRPRWVARDSAISRSVA